MDCYDIWVDLRNSHKDLEFAQAVHAYMGHLRQQGLIEGYRLTRRKLGFGPQELGEFHIRIETRDLAQLDRAFSQVVPRTGETEKLHAAVYGAVSSFRAALYRDFPDPGRAAKP